METNTNKNGLVQLIVNIAIPTLILVKGAETHYLNTVSAFCLAISIPLLYGAIDFIKSKRKNIFSIIGLFNIALTGGIGLLELPAQWLAVKEGAIPFAIGLIIMIFTALKKPILTPLFHQVIDDKKVLHKLDTPKKTARYHQKLHLSSYLITLSFFMSAFLNYILAKTIVVSPTGTEAFNKELGLMTALSFPVIALPSTIMLAIIFLLIIKEIKTLTGLSLDDIIRHP